MGCVSEGFSQQIFTSKSKFNDRIIDFAKRIAVEASQKLQEVQFE